MTRIEPQVERTSDRGVSGQDRNKLATLTLRQMIRFPHEPDSRTAAGFPRLASSLPGQPHTDTGCLMHVTNLRAFDYRYPLFGLDS